MARIEQGDALTVPQLQPGGKFSDDGYGLITATCVWKSDQGSSLNSVVNRGSSCPLAGASFCDAHKYAITYDSLGLTNIVVDYVGIDPTINSGVRTNPQVGTSQGLTTAHITSHKNFFELQAGFAAVIAGVGTGTLATPAYAAQNDVAGVVEYLGDNGARFERVTGGKFLGFKTPEYSTLYGRTSYLAPQTSFSGHFYTSDDADVTSLLAAVGKTSASNEFASIELLPAYMGTVFTSGWFGNDQLLLAQVNVEDFGLLYKVVYEVRFNQEGYEPTVYAPS
jgi:hypothetical protein